MIIEKLVLHNFRQFEGKQELVFSDIEDRNVTLVHAENGFGKTCLLCAFHWALYGQDGLPDGDFEQPLRIIHEHTAHNHPSPEASVELTFKHGGERYQLKRSISLAQQKHNLATNSKENTLELSYFRNGMPERVSNPKQKIQAIVPKGIADLLFFNAEGIDNLTMEQNADEVKDAIHQMLGLKLLRTTIDDLKHHSVRGAIRDELNRNSSTEKQTILNQIDAKEQELAKRQDEKKQLVRNYDSILAEIDIVETTLDNNREAHRLQHERSEIESEIKSLKTEMQQKQVDIKRLISEDGYVIFTSRLIESGSKMVAQLRDEGKLPANKVPRTVLQELLDGKSCICSTLLPEGSPQRAAIQALLDSSQGLELDNAVAKLDHALGFLDGRSEKVTERLKELNAERMRLQAEMDRREERLADIHQKLGSNIVEEVQALEDKRSRLVLSRDENKTEQGRLQVALEQIKKDLDDLQVRLRTIEEKGEKAKVAQRRLDAVEGCISLLEDILRVETEDLRPLLNREIKSKFEEIIDRNYTAELCEDFSLHVRKQIISGSGVESIEVAKNTALRQTLSLVFIATLVQLCSKRSEIPTILKGLTGSKYPIVMDSPFGSLDEHYGPEVLNAVSTLAPQVIILVSSKQYSGKVAAALDASTRIKNRYYMRYYGMKLPIHAERKIAIKGQEFDIYYELDHEKTEVVEI